MDSGCEKVCCNSEVFQAVFRSGKQQTLLRVAFSPADANCSQAQIA